MNTNLPIPPSPLTHRFSPFVNIKQTKWVNIVDVVPPETLCVWAMKLYSLTNLAWQYIDTILDIVIQMKIRETRPLVRAVRELKLEYDRFRARAINSKHIAEETQLAESFEDWLSKDFSKLFYALDFEVSRMDIVKSQRPLVIAVYQAVTIMEAVRNYARRLDNIVRSKYVINVADCCMIPTHFLSLYPLIPQFAGDCYVKDLPAVKTTSNLLANRMEESIIKKIHDD